jgi:hypothetical protein
VFTSDSTGYVVAPGRVISGSTNFTITDPNVATDFGNPLQAVFGLQPNTAAGQGQYIDYGMIKITGVAGVNEFEDFTTLGSDIVANLTPSGQFNNNALSGCQHDHCDDQRLLVGNWTQPAAASPSLRPPIWHIRIGSIRVV